LLGGVPPLYFCICPLPQFMYTRPYAAPSGASRPAADVSDVVGRPRTAWRRRAGLLGIYLVAVFSKRYVMPLVPTAQFWQVDFAYFVVLPLLLFLAGWRRPDLLMDGPEAL